MKLLDITEQPMGYAAAKKRKRQQDLEDAKRAAEEAAAQVSARLTLDMVTPLMRGIFRNIGSSRVLLSTECH